MRNLLIIGLLSVSLFKLQAQTPDKSFIHNIPQDSLMFMLHFDQERLANDSTFMEIKEELPDGIKEMLQYCNEFCFYGQNKELYDCYTINFKIKGQIPQQKVQTILEELDLKVTGFTSRSFRLKGGQHRYGFLFNGDNYSTLKIYTQTNPVNAKIRAQHQQLLSLLWNHDEYDDNAHVHHQLDSLARLDSLDSQTYFDNLLRSHQQGIDKGEDIQLVPAPLKYDNPLKQVVEHKALVLYVNPQMIEGLPYHLISAFNYHDYNHIDWFAKLGMGFKMHDQIWLGASVNADKIQVESLFQNNKKKQQYYKKLDKDLLKYLPAEVPLAFGIYNTDVAVLKKHLLKHFSFYDMNEEERAIFKLALLAVDDDIINILGNGFICVNEDVKGKDIPDFKLVLKMPDPDKGQALLDVLWKDLDVFKRVGTHTYRSKESDKDIHLCIEKDVWILGTAPIETLKQQSELKEIKQRYPILANKSVVQYITIGDESSSGQARELNKVVMTTKLLNKKTLKTTIIVDRKWMESNL